MRTQDANDTRMRYSAALSTQPVVWWVVLLKAGGPLSLVLRGQHEYRMRRQASGCFLSLLAHQGEEHEALI